MTEIAWRGLVNAKARRSWWKAALVIAIFAVAPPAQAQVSRAAGVLGGIGQALSDMADQRAEDDRQMKIIQRQHDLGMQRIEREHQLRIQQQERERQEREATMRRKATEEAAAKAIEDERRRVEARKSGTSGSGFFVSKYGHVVTNAHVVGDYTNVLVKDSASKLYEALVVKVDHELDLALLRIDRPSTGLRIANSTAELKGEEVFTIGYPMPGVQGQESKITSGLVSSLSGIRGVETWMQISAPIQGGNSGGPLVTANGDVVGVVVASINAKKILEASGSLAQNVNYAIKSEQVLSFLRDLSVTTKAISVQGKPLRYVDQNTVMVLARDLAFSESYVAKPSTARMLSPDDQDEADFRTAIGSDRPAALQHFLLFNPKSRYIAQVKGQLARLEREQWLAASRAHRHSVYKSFVDDFPESASIAKAGKRLRQLDASAWRTAARENTVLAYQEYLSELPFGDYRSDATGRISRLDAEAWVDADQLGTQQSYAAYLNQFSSGRHSAEARKKLATLRNRESTSAQGQTGIAGTALAMSMVRTKTEAKTVGEVLEIYQELGYVVISVTGSLMTDRPVSISTSASEEVGGTVSRTTSGRASILVPMDIARITKGDRVVQ